MRVTTGAVARHAGVSRSTVDRVLNRRGDVSAAAERAVLQSARALGYGLRLDAVPTRMLRICVLMQSPANPFYSLLAQGFAAANRDFAAARATAYLSYIDIESPAAICEQIERIPAEYDALVVVVPVRGDIGARLRGIAGRIPVVAISTDLDADVPHRYVGPDNYQAGRLAGELMGRLLGREGGGVLVVGGLPAFRGHVERRAGFADVLAARFPRSSIVQVIEGGDPGTGIAPAVGRALRRNPSIRGIYNITQGNREIVEQALAVRRNDRPTIVCHDLTSVTAELLRQGHIDVVLDQDPMLEARRAVEIVLQHYGRREGDEPGGRIPIHPVFRECLDPAPAGSA